MAVLAFLGPLELCAAAASASTTETLYLSGTGADDTVRWNFRVDRGMRANQTTTIPVPSCWELQGFGEYEYGYVSRDQKPAPARAKGIYSHHFDVPSTWSDRRIFLVFDGVMTDAEVKVNGQLAGPVHQGGFYRFRYDVTPLLRFGEPNALEVTVAKESANPSVNRAERRADYWNFAGIFRPVYLQAVPQQFLDRVAIDARADGSLTMQAVIGGEGEADTLVVEVIDREGNVLLSAPPYPVPQSEHTVTMQLRLANPSLWTAETPNLYLARVRLQREGVPQHTIEQRFGFRTIELRTDSGLFVNGKKIRLRGVCRHSFHPDNGRTTSRAISRQDIETIKAMNMNAVRTVHYPPDAHFLELCDEMGLYVMDELGGWHGKYDTTVGQGLVREMVTRDVNHPSIILWANGNEGGWNRQLDGEFAKWDLQNRVVLHPWEKFNGIHTGHYPRYDELKTRLETHLTLPTEFLHGLYDGGHGAGLADYWEAIRSSPRGLGGFLWALMDESVKRTDLGGKLDGQVNLAPDGIVGPYREREGSFYAIRDLWSPVRIVLAHLPDDFDGTIPVENDYDFTNLNQCSFGYELWDFPKPADDTIGHLVREKGTVPAPNVEPGQAGTLRLSLPADWRQADALYLVASDVSGRPIRSWTWPTQSLTRMVSPHLPTASDGADLAAPVASVAGRNLRVQAGPHAFVFSLAEGRLEQVTIAGKPADLSGGPDLIAEQAPLPSDPRLNKAVVSPPVPLPSVKPPPSVMRKLVHRLEGHCYLIRAEFDGPLRLIEWQVNAQGQLRLHFEYRLDGEFDYYGVAFRCPEAKLNGVKWLGNGPYRVWKNRLAGAALDVWSKPHNNVRTGGDWGYPEFKGFHAFGWAVLETEACPITMLVENPGDASEQLYLGLFTPRFPPDPKYATAVMPEADIALLHAIPGIGCKGFSAALSGPMGQKTHSATSHSATVWFQFGKR